MSASKLSKKEALNKINEVIYGITQVSPLEGFVVGYIIDSPELYFDNQAILSSNGLFKNDIYSIIFSELKKMLDMTKGNINQFYVVNLKNKIESLGTIEGSKISLKNHLEKILIQTGEEIKETGIFDPIYNRLKPDYNLFMSKLKDLIYYQKERALIEKALSTAKIILEPKFSNMSIEKRNNALVAHFKESEATLESDSDVKIIDNNAAIDVLRKISDPTFGIKYLKTEIGELDDFCPIGGEKLIIVGGRPGMGKTSFALSMFMKLVKSNYNAMLFSLEMSSKPLILKFGNIISKKNLKKFLNKDTGVYDLPDSVMDEITNELENHFQTMSLIDKPSIRVGEIKRYITQKNLHGRISARDEYAKTEDAKNGIPISEAFLNKNNIDIVFIDYLQIMGKTEKPHFTESMRVAEITKELKKLTIELNIPIVLLSQLNRNVTGQLDKRPTMSDLRDSGSIEQDADIVILLHREYYYHKQKDATATLTKEELAIIEDISEIIIAKNRDGETGTLYMSFSGKLQEFSSLSDVEIETKNEDGSITTISLKADEVKNTYKEICNKVVNSPNSIGGNNQMQGGAIDVNKYMNDIKQRIAQQQQQKLTNANGQQISGQNGQNFSQGSPQVFHSQKPPF